MSIRFRYNGIPYDGMFFDFHSLTRDGDALNNTQICSYSSAYGTEVTSKYAYNYIDQFSYLRNGNQVTLSDFEIHIGGKAPLKELRVSAVGFGVGLE